MNKGIALSKGDWLFFLGTDDKLYAQETLSSIFNKQIDNDIELILGKVQFERKKPDTYFIRKNNGVATPSWSKKLWLKNTLPHQGIFYRRSLFDNKKYDLRYLILADYAFNLGLFKTKTKVEIVDEIITLCGTGGISKRYNVKLYKEEIKLKTEASSVWLKPFFIFLSGIKYTVKRLGL